MTLPPAFESLPGWELIRPGLADLVAGVVSPEACLVAIASPHLRAAGLLAGTEAEIPEPERMLYTLLRQRPGDAYPEYQNLLRRLARFERSLARLN